MTEWHVEVYSKRVGWLGVARFDHLPEAELAQVLLEARRARQAFRIARYACAPDPSAPK